MIIREIHEENDEGLDLSDQGRSEEEHKEKWRSVISGLSSPRFLDTRASQHHRLCDEDDLENNKRLARL